MDSGKKLKIINSNGVEESYPMYTNKGDFQQGSHALCISSGYGYKDLSIRAYKRIVNYSGYTSNASGIKISAWNTSTYYLDIYLDHMCEYNVSLGANTVSSGQTHTSFVIGNLAVSNYNILINGIKVGILPAEYIGVRSQTVTNGTTSASEITKAATNYSLQYQFTHYYVPMSTDGYGALSGNVNSITVHAGASTSPAYCKLCQTCNTCDSCNACDTCQKCNSCQECNVSLDTPTCDECNNNFVCDTIYQGTCTYSNTCALTYNTGCAICVGTCNTGNAVCNTCYGGTTCNNTWSSTGHCMTIQTCTSNNIGETCLMDQLVPQNTSNCTTCYSTVFGYACSYQNSCTKCDVCNSCNTCQTKDNCVDCYTGCQTGVSSCTLCDSNNTTTCTTCNTSQSCTTSQKCTSGNTSTTCTTGQTYICTSGNETTTTTCTLCDTAQSCTTSQKCTSGNTSTTCTTGQTHMCTSGNTTTTCKTCVAGGYQSCRNCQGTYTTGIKNTCSICIGAYIYATCGSGNEDTISIKKTCVAVDGSEAPCTYHNSYTTCASACNNQNSTTCTSCDTAQSCTTSQKCTSGNTSTTCTTGQSYVCNSGNTTTTTTCTLCDTAQSCTTSQKCTSGNE